MLLITEHAIFKYDPHFLTSTYLWRADSGRHLFLFILTHFSNCPLMILKHSFLMPFTQVLRKKLTMSVTVYMYSVIKSYATEWMNIVHVLISPLFTVPTLYDINISWKKDIFSRTRSSSSAACKNINSCNLELVTEMSHTLTKCILLSQNYMYQIHAKNYW